MVIPQATAGPLMAPCTSGFLVTFNESVTEFPQLPVANTVTYPITVPAVIDTCMLFVPCPLVMVIPFIPVGTVHV